MVFVLREVIFVVLKLLVKLVFNRKIENIFLKYWLIKYKYLVDVMKNVLNVFVFVRNKVFIV